MGRLHATEQVFSLLCGRAGRSMSLDQLRQETQLKTDELALCVVELIIANHVEMVVTPHRFGVYRYPLQDHSHRSTATAAEMSQHARHPPSF